MLWPDFRKPALTIDESGRQPFPCPHCGVRIEQPKRIQKICGSPACKRKMRDAQPKRRAKR